MKKGNKISEIQKYEQVSEHDVLPNYKPKLSDNKILFVSLGLISVTYALFIGYDCRLTLIEAYQVLFKGFSLTYFSSEY